MLSLNLKTFKMAAIINRISTNPKKLLNISNVPNLLSKRDTSLLKRSGRAKVGTIKHRNLIQSTEDYLAARGFLRNQKGYAPPTDAVERVKKVLSSALGNNIKTDAPMTRAAKFNILKDCFKEFNHSVPNSMLTFINTPMDVLNFYTDPVVTTNPFEQMKSQVLPPNLHIEFEYVRFNADTDTMFGGVTAYPESSTLITGLKYKNKYAGYNTKPPAHLDQWSDYIKHDHYDGKDDRNK